MVKQAAALLFKSKLGRYLYISEDEQNVPALIQMSMGIPTYIESGHYNSSVHCLDVHEIH